MYMEKTLEDQLAAEVLNKIPMVSDTSDIEGTIERQLEKALSSQKTPMYGYGKRLSKDIYVQDDDIILNIEIFCEQVIDGSPKNDIDGFTMDDVSLHKGVTVQTSTKDKYSKSIGTVMDFDEFVSTISNPSTRIKLSRCMNDLVAGTELSEDLFDLANSIWVNRGVGVESIRPVVIH